MLPERPVIFLGYFNNLERARSPIRKICKQLEAKPPIVYRNYDIKLLAASLGCESIYFDQLLTKEDYEFMNDYLFRLTRNWYRDLRESPGVTECNGIKLGELIQEDAARFFCSSIKDLEITLKIIKKVST